MKITLMYGEYDCIILVGEYANGRTALQLFDEVDGSPIATATVNIPEEPLNDGEVFIKAWSENEGMLETLIDNKIVEDTGRIIPIGYVFANVCRLLPQEGWGK